MKRPGGFDGPSRSSEQPAEKVSQARKFRLRRRTAIDAADVPDAPDAPGAPDLPQEEALPRQPRGQAQAVSSQSDLPLDTTSAPIDDAQAATEIAHGPASAAEREPESPPSVLPISELQAEPESDGVKRARDELRRAERSRRSRERAEQRRFTAHLRARRRKWLVALAAVTGLALFVVAGVYTPIMAVRNVQVEGATTVNSDELQRALARFEGVPLALVDDRDVHRSLEPFPLIQRYAIERIPPHTLIVRIDERVPVIALERDEGFDLLDAAGVLLSRVAERPAGVPLGSAELGDSSSPAFRAASAVVRDMPEDLRARLVSVSASNAQNVTFVLDSQTELVWGDAKQTQRKAAVLRALLSAIGTPAMIDVSAPEAPVFS